MTERTPDTDDNLVWYCRSCHSLRVMIDDSIAMDGWDGSYCGECHSTDIGVCDINDWLAEEERRRKKREEIEWSKL